jgi:hypothetical protein
MSVVIRWRKKRRERRAALRRSRKQRVKLDAQIKAQARAVDAAARVIARHSDSLREKAYYLAAKMVGIMEHGGNNTGPEVAKIIRANGGVVGEPWCGDFMAYVYRAAGSKGVDRSWASVSLTGNDPDVRRTSSPKRGDLVRFTFDHIGMFVRDRGDGTIETVEGNTGASGAVSDSTTGGDGVYRKVRAKSLVRDYLEVKR